MALKYLFFCNFIFLTFLTFGQDNHDWGNINRFKSQNAQILSMKTKVNVVFMGNSITQGWYETDPKFFTENNFVNRGIGGQTTPQMLVRFRSDVINLKPKVVVILAGINDIAQNTGPITTQETADNIISMAELAQANDIIPIICSILPANTFPWRPSIKPADLVIEINSILENYCNKNGLTYLNYYTQMVDSQKGLLKKYTTDGVHCTTEGYQKMRSILEPVLTMILSEGAKN